MSVSNSHFCGVLFPLVSRYRQKFTASVTHGSHFEISFKPYFLEKKKLMESQTTYMQLFKKNGELFSHLHSNEVVLYTKLQH